jgi:hypothetical protein
MKLLKAAAASEALLLLHHSHFLNRMNAILHATSLNCLFFADQIFFIERSISIQRDGDNEY